jgi:hypothetical protein
MDGPPERDRSKLAASLIGAAALTAWFVLLYYMFGDVL